MREFRCDWRDLFHAFSIALDLKKISLSFLGIGVSLLGIIAILLFGVYCKVDTSGRETMHNALTDAKSLGQVVTYVNTAHEINFGGKPMHGITERSLLAKEFRNCVSMFVPVRKIRRYMAVFWPRTGWGWALLGVALLWIWMWWGYFGGAITRIAAVEIARNERIEVSAATKFASQHRWSYVMAPLVVVLGMGLIVGVLALGGLVCRTPVVGKVFLVLGFPFALLAGFILLRLFIGLVMGWLLMPPAISAEGTESIDAIGRSLSYVSAHPWRYLWYLFVTTLYAIPCCIFVYWFAKTSVALTFWAGGLGMGDVLTPVLARVNFWFGSWLDVPVVSQVSGADSVGVVLSSFLVGSMLMIVIGFVYAYIPSFILSAFTMIYLLLRHATDSTDMNDVYIEDEEHDLTLPLESVDQKEQEPPPDTDKT